MSTLPFLESYSGQSTEGLLSLEGHYRVDSIVLAFEEALSRKSTHTPEELAVLAVEALEREVNNGGFQQFFTNSSCQYTSVLVEALQAIGCPQTAAIAAKAIAALAVDGNLTPELIERAIDGAGEDLEEALGALDALYYQGPEEPIVERLLAFIKSNRCKVKADAA